MEIIVKPTQINGIGPCGRFFWIGRESETVATIFETTCPVSAKSWLRARGKVERCSEVGKVHRLGEVNAPDDQSCKSVNFHTKVLKPAPVVPLASIICAVSWEEKSNRNIWEHKGTIDSRKTLVKPTQANVHLQRMSLCQCCLCCWWNWENRVNLWKKILGHHTFHQMNDRLYSLSDIVWHSCRLCLT